MKKAYICSPYKGNIKKNIAFALKCSQTAYSLGYLPICVHCFLESVTGLKEKGNREELLRAGKEYLKICDECWVCTKEISPGMEEEIDFAKKNKIKIRRIY